MDEPGQQKSSSFGIHLPEPGAQGQDKVGGGDGFPNDALPGAIPQGQKMVIRNHSTGVGSEKNRGREGFRKGNHFLRKPRPQSSRSHQNQRILCRTDEGQGLFQVRQGRRFWGVLLHGPVVLVPFHVEEIGGDFQVNRSRPPGLRGFNGLAGEIFRIRFVPNSENRLCDIPENFCLARDFVEGADAFSNFAGSNIGGDHEQRDTAAQSLLEGRNRVSGPGTG